MCFSLLFCITGIAQMLGLWLLHCCFKETGTCGRWYLLLIPLITLVSRMWCLSVLKRRPNQGILISTSLGVCILFGGRERSDGTKPQLAHKRALIFVRARTLQKVSHLSETSVGTSIIQIFKESWRRASPLCCFLTSTMENIPLLLGTGMDYMLWQGWFGRVHDNTCFQ